MRYVGKKYGQDNRGREIDGSLQVNASPKLIQEVQLREYLEKWMEVGVAVGVVLGVVAGGVRATGLSQSCYVAAVLPFMETVSGFGLTESSRPVYQQRGTCSQKREAD